MVIGRDYPQLHKYTTQGKQGAIMTIRDYADSRKVTYEAVRQLVNRLSGELEGHITKKGRTRYLDDEAVQILDERRNGSKVSVIKAKVTENDNTIDQLKNEIILLQRQLLECKDSLRIASENVARLEAVTDTNKQLQAKIDTLEGELHTYQRTIFGFYRKVKG